MGYAIFNNERSILKMPKVVNHQQYRKKLLNQCFDLFAEKGFASLTTRQIAQALGVSTGTLYYYFPSKEDLFIQLIEELTQQDIFKVSEKLEGLNSLREQILAFAEWLENNESYFIKQRLLVTNFYQQIGGEQSHIHQSFKQMLEGFRAELMRVLKINDPVLMDHILFFFDGIISDRMIAPMIASEMISYREQAELLAKMLSTYLDRE